MRTPGRCSAGPAHSQAIVRGRCVTPWSSCTSSPLPLRPQRSRSRWVGRRRGRFARRRERSCSQKGEGHQQLLIADLVSACGHFNRKMALALIDQALAATKIVANLRPAGHSSSRLPMLAQVAPHHCQRGLHRTKLQSPALLTTRQRVALQRCGISLVAPLGCKSSPLLHAQFRRERAWRSDVSMVEQRCQQKRHPKVPLAYQ